MLLIAVRGPVDLQRLRYQVADTHIGAEAGEGVLEDDLRPLPERHQVRAAEVGDVSTLEDDAAGADRRQVQRRPAQRRLAAAGLAHDGHRLSQLQDQVNRPHRLDRPRLEQALAHVERDAQILYAEDRFVVDEIAAHVTPSSGAGALGSTRQQPAWWPPDKSNSGGASPQGS